MNTYNIYPTPQNTKVLSQKWMRDSEGRAPTCGWRFNTPSVPNHTLGIKCVVFWDGVSSYFSCVASFFCVCVSILVPPVHIAVPKAEQISVKYCHMDQIWHTCPESSGIMNPHLGINVSTLGWRCVNIWVKCRSSSCVSHLISVCVCVSSCPSRAFATCDLVAKVLQWWLLGTLKDSNQDCTGWRWCFFSKNIQ